jgi:hypothetical protein
MEGRPIVCKGKSRPYKRCLNFQAARARNYALKQRWITSEKYTWSGEFDNSSKLENYLETLGSFEDFEAMDNQVEMNYNDDIMPADAIDKDNSDDESHVS